MNRKHFGLFLLFLGCDSNLEVLDSSKDVPQPFHPKTESKITQPIQVPILKTHGQLRETYEAITGVAVPAEEFDELVTHLPQDNRIESLTATSQAAIVRLASAHCWNVLENAEQTKKLFGIPPGNQQLEFMEVATLHETSIGLWPRVDDTLSAEMKAMLNEVRETIEQPSRTNLLMAACTAALASAPITTH